MDLNLNKYLIRNVHYTTSWEDALHGFKNGQYFSTLDAKSGYWTKKRDEQSQLLNAFNTPFKKYCFVCLPFELSGSSEIFCKEMDQVLSGVPGTFPCADDFKVLKFKDPQKNVTTFTCWKRFTEHTKQGWNLTQISAA